MTQPYPILSHFSDRVEIEYFAISSFRKRSGPSVRLIVYPRFYLSRVFQTIFLFFSPSFSVDNDLAIDSRNICIDSIATAFRFSLYIPSPRRVDRRINSLAALSDTRPSGRHAPEWLTRLSGLLFRLFAARCAGKMRDLNLRYSPRSISRATSAGFT